MSAISKPGPEDDGDASGGVTKPVDGSRLITRHHKTMTLIIQKMKMFSLFRSGRGSRQGGGDTDARIGAPTGGDTTGVSTGGSTASETGGLLKTQNICRKTTLKSSVLPPVLTHCEICARVVEP